MSPGPPDDEATRACAPGHCVCLVLFRIFISDLLDNAMLQVHLLGKTDYKFSVFIVLFTNTCSRTRTRTHTPHLYSPLFRCSHGWLFLTTRCLAQGLLLTNGGPLKSHRALHITCAEACHARPRCNRRRESFYRALGNQPLGIFQLMV